MANEIMRGDVWYCDLPRHDRVSLQTGYRPCLIISNNAGNRNQDFVTVLPITTKLKEYPMNVDIRLNSTQLNSQILTNQIQSIPKYLVKNYIETLPYDVIERVEEVLLFSLGISKFEVNEYQKKQQQVEQFKKDSEFLKEKIPHAVQLIRELQEVVHRYNSNISVKESNGVKSSYKRRRTEQEIKDMCKRFYILHEDRQSIMKDYGFETDGAFYQAVSAGKKKYNIGV